MAKLRNQWEQTARQAAERIDRDRDLAEQLTMLPDDSGDLPAEVPTKGRPPGSTNKGSSQMREWLASRGLRLPEDVIVQMAGLSDSADAITTAMAKTERILAWAFDGAHIGDKAAPYATATMRLQTFMQVYTIQLRAAEALLPYGTPKASPDVQVTQQTTFILSGGQGPEQGQTIRDVTPQSGRSMAPPPLPKETQQNQQVSEIKSEGSDG